MENTSSEQKNKSVSGIFELSLSVVMLFNGILILLTNIKYYGTEILYIWLGCYVLLVLSGVWCVVEFIKLLKRHGLKKSHIACAVITLVILVMWGIGASIYAKDIFGGTKTITTEFYRPYENRILIDREFDGNYNGFSLKCSKKTLEPLRGIFHFDESVRMKVSDNISVYKSSPKIEIEYYPNTEIIKEINVIE